jgi:energy-coupling factor transport system ATP-binding protein
MRISYEHVTYTYNSGTSPALQDINLEFDTSSITGICGRTGSGKSTFVQHINGILKPNSGRVRIDDHDIHSSSASLKQVRQRVGMTFQFPERKLFGKTVWEELAYTLERRQIPEKEIAHRIEFVSELLQVDIPRSRDRSPFSLSRKEQRKLGIAVVLSLQPELLVLDEPTAGMDRRSSYQLLDLLSMLHHRGNLHIILVSHNIELLLKYTEYVIVLSEGKISLIGTPLKVLNASNQLERFGIHLPPVNRTLHLLQRKYSQINTGILSINDAVEEVTRHIGQLETHPA